MKIFLVCSTAKTWMNTGYGAGLLAGEGQLLVSFVEFMKNPEQPLAVTTMQVPYKPIVNRDARAIDEFKGLLRISVDHKEALIPEEDDASLPSRPRRKPSR